MKKAFVNSVDSIIVELLFFFHFFSKSRVLKGSDNCWWKGGITSINVSQPRSQNPGKDFDVLSYRVSKFSLGLRFSLHTKICP